MFQTLRRINWRAFVRPWENLDWWLLGGVTALTMLGGIMIYSIQLKQETNDWIQHLGVGCIGLILVFLISWIRYDLLLRWRWGIYVAINIGLLLVKFIGTVELGARRWINIFGFHLQPSEFAKLGIIITLAALLHERPAHTLPAMFRAIAVVSLPWILIFLEPNLGTSLIFGAILLGMLYWANANPGWLVLMLSPVVAAILLNAAPSALKNINPTLEPVGVGLWGLWVIVMGFVAFRCLPWKKWGTIAVMVVNLISGILGNWLWSNILQEYQRKRVTMFINPDQDPMGGGYHLIQSRIAIGAGELTGRGITHGTQTQLSFIPEQHTDFIFAAVGEELGFLGCLAVLLTFLLICFRLLVIAQNARDDFGSLIAVGVFSMLVFQTVVNIGMTMNLSPVTGIPLPYLSYGKSALLMNFLAIGVVQAVANHRQRSRF
ncbi:MAG: rod shape-determining protein RodA [Synechococcales bacterium]|nr:rod shape-determining protein RodA [Synechococcales bacterium]